MNTDPWYVLHVSSNREKRVAQHLMVRSVEHYLPLYSERVKWTDRTVITDRPLFSGYVFARFPRQQRINAISTPGVLRLLGDEQQDMVKDEELEKIRTGLKCGAVLRPHNDLAVGTRVRVCRGVFSGTDGVVSALRHRCKVVLTLSATQQAFSFEISLNDLQVLDSNSPKAIMSVPGSMQPAYLQTA
jgi:transcription antitermination factor NusG